MIPHETLRHLFCKTLLLYNTSPSRHSSWPHSISATARSLSQQIMFTAKSNVLSVNQSDITAGSAGAGRSNYHKWAPDITRHSSTTTAGATA